MGEVRKDHQRLLHNMKLIQKNFGVKELCSLLGITKTTWINRMKAPWEFFSYDDLRSIARYTRIDFIKIVDGELGVM